ncbi:sigma-70 family RNA polymerase sigma factor [Planctomycetales bacterium ZRK34]|nr:sigma-70 family RNA polymerase sigma factor [Planctomycetales bacterium ZRK34]
MPFDPSAISNDPGRLEAFVSEFGRTQRPLFLHILSLTADPIAAEDILQETNLVLWRKFDEFEPGTSFHAWAAKIAYYQILKWRESQNRAAMSLAPEVIARLADESVDFSAEFETRRRALRQCLTKLSDADRELITQRYQPGQTGRSIAQRLGRPENSVYKSIGRIRAALLRCIRNALAEGGAA